jgi:hypothetical protein
MQDLPFKQVGKRGEVDVRMWAYINAFVAQELGRAHLVEEDKRSDHLSLAGG